MVRDYSEFDAANEEIARERHDNLRRRMQAAVKAAAANGGADRRDYLRDAYEYFRASEQINDAFFFAHNSFIDDIVEVRLVEVPGYR